MELNNNITVLDDDIKDFYYSNHIQVKKEIFKELRKIEGGKKARRHLEYKYIDFMKYAFLDYINTKGIFLSWSRRDSIELIKNILIDIYNKNKELKINKISKTFKWIEDENK